MKKLIGKLTRAFTIVLCLLSGLLVNDLQAQQAFDPNGTTSIGGNGFSWDTTTKIWTPNNTQTQVASASLVAWTAGNTALFCAGPSSSTSQGSFTDFITGTVSVGAIVCGSDNPGACNITLNGPGNISLASASTLFLMGGTGGSSETLNCLITGASGNVLQINNSSSSSTSLFGTNTYAGGTQILGSGAINFNNNSSFGTGTITWSAGGFVQASGASAITIANSMTSIANTIETFSGNTAGVTFGGPMALGSTGYVELENIAGTIIFGGPISGSAALTFTNKGGNLTLTGANTFTGTLTNGGTLTIGGSGSLGSGNYSQTILNRTNLVYSSSANQLLSGVISGAGKITANGSGTLTLGAVETFTGAISNSGTLVISNAGTIVAATVITNNGTFNYNSTAAQTISGVISGTGGVNQNGSGTLTLTGANTTTGTFTLNAGTVGVGNLAAFGSVSPAAVVINGGRLGNNSGTGRTIAAPVALSINADFTVDDSQFTTAANGQILFNGPATLNNGNRTINVDQPNGQTVNLGLAGAIGQDVAGRGIIKTGSGILALNGVNTYSGDTTISNGQININATSTLGNGAGNIFLSGGNINVTADRGTTTANLLNPVSLNTNAQFLSAGTTGTRNLVFGGAFSTTAGTLTLHENGTGAGPAIFNVRFTNTFTFSRPITFTVDTAGHSINLDIWNLTSLGDQTYSGVISGAGSIRRSATTAATGGRVILSGTNTFSGGTSLNDGEIALGSDCAGAPDAPTSSPLGTGTNTIGNDRGKLSAFGAARNLFNHLLFSGGSHLTLIGANDLTLSGNVDLGAQTVVFTNNNTGNSTVAGGISDGSFTFQGPNALTLAGTNTYSGATTISSSTLALAATGSIAGSSSVSIAAGATFDVSAISAYAFGSTTLSASGNASAATINGASGGTVNLGSSAITLAFDGTDPALTISQGTLNLNGNAFTVNGSVLAPGSYNIVSQANGSISSAGTFAVGGTAIGAGKTGSISVSGGNVVLTIITIPTFSSLTSSPSVSYGATSVSLGGTLSATGPIYPANGDTVTATINGHAVNGTVTDTTGDFTIVYNDISLATDGVGGSPYTITYTYGGNLSVGLTPATNVSTALAVGAASLSVTASNQSKTYGQTVTTTGSTAFSSVGLQNGETIGSVTLSISGGGAASNAPVSGSPYIITPSVATGGTFNTNNYAITYNTNALTVNPATLTVTADNFSRAFGATNPVFTATYTNFVNGETLGTSDVVGSPALTTGADTNSDVGSYTITNNTGTLASTNYTFSLVNGTLTVTNALSTNVVTADVNPALPGATVTLTSTLSTLAPSMAVPSGTVQFLTNGTAYGSAVTLTNGAAAIAISTLPHGYNTVEADFAGTTNLSGATNILGSTNTLSVLINTPPVAGTANYQRPAGTSLTIKITDLLTNATDADGDAITLASVSATSTNGATIFNDGTYLHYLPPGTNGDVADAFLYSVSDTFGATNQGTVMVSVFSNNGPSVNITGMTTLPNGTALINFAGIPNRSYLIQATTNLTPAIVWTTLSTNTAGTNGLFQYNDTDSTNYPTRYYRTTTP